MLQLDTNQYYRDPATLLRFAVVLFSQLQEGKAKFKNMALTEQDSGAGDRGAGLLLLGALARMDKAVSLSNFVRA
jgi:hypothetical protein